MYGYLGSMRTTPGSRDEVVKILTAGDDALKAAGCELYLVGVDSGDPDLIWITEMWLSKQHHENSLQLPETRAAIAAAMPMLTGDFESHELEMVGGLGYPEGRA